MATTVTTAKEVLHEKDFKKYGSGFQLAALSLFLQDKAFAHQLRAILQPEYFDTKYLRDICSISIEYLNEYNNPPGFEVLKGLIKNKVKEQLVELYTSTLSSIEGSNLKDRIYIEKTVFEFCATKHALQKTEEAMLKIEIGDLQGAQSLMYDGFKPISGTAQIFDFKRDYKKVFDVEVHKPIATPLEPLNLVSKGGPGAGDLCIAVAPSNFGKTNWLVACARHAASLGIDVAYFSLETKEVQLVQRALAGLANISQGDLAMHPKLIEAEMSKLPGNIQLMQFRATQATIPRIKGGVEEMKANGFFPGMILVDGLNQLKLVNGSHGLDNNAKFEALCEELRDYANDEKVPIHTVFQTNRQGFNTEINDEQQIGKAIEPLQVADWLIIFSQTVDMEEVGEARVRLLKNRLGPKGLTLKLAYNPDFGTFKVIEQEKLSMLYSKMKLNNEEKGLTAASEFLASRKIKQTPLSAKKDSTISE